MGFAEQGESIQLVGLQSGNGGVSKAKVLLLNQAAGPLFLELAEDLAKATGAACLITGSRVTPRHSSLDVRISTEYDRRSLLTRAWSWIRFLLFASREIWELGKGSVPVVVVTNPPFLPLLALAAKRLRKEPYLVLVYDIHPDVVAALGKIAEDGIIARLWSAMNRVVFREARFIVTLGPHMARTLGKYCQSDSVEGKLRIVPTWVDTERLRPLEKPRNPFAEKYGQIGKLTVLYSGYIGFSHDIGPIIEAAVKLREDPAFHFLIIGDGPGKSGLEEAVKEKALSNVTLLPLQPEEILPYSLATGDVAVVSIREGIEGLMMPSKTYYSMAVGSAILGISRAPNDLVDVIERYRCGANIDPSASTEKFVAELKRFESDRAYLDACRENARKAAVESFSRKVNTNKMLRIVQGMAEAVQK